jgi:p-hydroxybenzoate 3-monooxygenase
VRTQVAVVGAGPAGLLLSQLLSRRGVETVVLEHRSRAYVESRVRAGVLERTTVDALKGAGVGDRLEREGLVHRGLSLAFDGRKERVDLSALTGGGTVTVYGQTKVTQDLVAARIDAGADLRFDAEAIAIEGIDSEQPRVTYRQAGREQHVTADFVAGCDGFHGISRRSAPERAVTTFEKTYPFGWLGILSATPPIDQELVYANHERGFALCSMRSHAVSRYYLQCSADDEVVRWTDDAFWDELRRRLPASLAEGLVTGPRLEMSIALLRSFVAEPMRFGRLLLAGDAAHVVPPTGAKGLNLAAADVHYLALALSAFYEARRTDLLDRYSEVCLRRVWRAVRFSWWLTTLLHKLDDGPMGRRLQLAELDYLGASRSAQATFAENYVGLSFEAFD